MSEQFHRTYSDRIGPCNKCLKSGFNLSDEKFLCQSCFWDWVQLEDRSEAGFDYVAWDNFIGEEKCSS